MLRLLLLSVALLAFVPASAQPVDDAPPADEARYVLAIHGGAGVIERGSMTPEREAAYRAALEEALRAGHAVIQNGGSALDAVTAAIPLLEDSPLFNAGRGAVFTSEGTVELDASIMSGETLAAGAVAGVKHIKNPIRLARLVMEASPHVMMTGDGAEAFAAQHDVETVPNEYFYTESRREALDRVQERERNASGDAGRTPEAWQMTGTVGAVARDQRGHLAAATSTGGMTNKRFGRVGDAPIPGAGTYADDRTCAVSATGHGEYFIRLAVAHDVSARMMYLGESVAEASRAVIHERLGELGGTGGVIAIDGEGRVAMPFNTPGMFRGTIDADGNVTVEIYREG
ncbi:MAG: isoaspartyl peptidase/L-asparaginase [Rhodothermales bacterium]